MLKKPSNPLILITLLSVVLFGCQAMKQFSPEQVISNALAAENEVSYYGEIEWSVTGVEGLGDITMKEWRYNEKLRTESMEDGQLVITVNDGEALITYNESENSAFKVDDQEFQELNLGPKEQVEFVLNIIKDTHDIETAGEEKVVNRDTFHLVAKQKQDQKNIIGDLELWIDKEYWLVLKMEMATGNMQQTLEYTTIDFNPKMDDTIFQMDLPEDVEMQYLDDFNDLLSGEEIALNEIPEKIGENALYIPNNKTYILDTITYLATEGVLSSSEVTLDYVGENELPLLSLTIISTEEEENGADGLDIFDQEIDQVNVRNTEGEFFELMGLRILTWSEENLNYSIHLMDEKITLDDVLALTKEMKKIK